MHRILFFFPPIRPKFICEAASETDGGYTRICQGDTMRAKSLIYLLVITFLFVAPALFGANVLVSTMDLATFFTQSGDLNTRGQFELGFNGGYKYHAELSFEYLNKDLETNTSQSLIFGGASESVNRVGGFFDFTYWTGYKGVIGEGDYYIGHLYHRDENFEYRGYLPLLGTGLIFGVRSRDDKYGGKVYTYQQYGVGYLNSVDLEFNLNTGPILFNVYAGESDNDWRVGLQFKYRGDKTGISLTMGNLNLRSGNILNFDNLYFLLEQRFSTGNWNFIPSVFARPKYHYDYVNRTFAATNETNDIDFNFNLNFAPETRNFGTGTELTVRTSSVEELGVSISPYAELYTPGVIWRLKVDFNVLTETRDLVTGHLNINASF